MNIDFPQTKSTILSSIENSKIRQSIKNDGSLKSKLDFTIPENKIKKNSSLKFDSNKNKSLSFGKSIKIESDWF
jgi:hypothetical protein